jgi:hypothetical protein
LLAGIGLGNVARLSLLGLSLTCASAGLSHCCDFVIMSSKRTSLKKREVRLDMEDKLVITQHAAELVEELMNTIRGEDGTPWFITIERKMRKLTKRLLCKREDKR